MPSSSRLKGKVHSLWAWGCERCLLRTKAASPVAVRSPSPLEEGPGWATGQGIGLERELEEDEVEEEVEEEDREGKLGKELKALSSSSASRIEGSHGGTGVHGCQPGATEQDLTSCGLRSSLCWPREALWLRQREDARLKRVCNEKDKSSVTIPHRALNSSLLILCPRGKEMKQVTLEGPLKSWIFTSMALIHPCISSGESVYRQNIQATTPYYASVRVLYSSCWS